MNQQRISQLLQMMAEDPCDPFCKYALALEYSSDNQFHDKAEEVLVQLMESHPDYLPLYYQLSNIWIKAGKHQEAKALIGKGRKLAKDLHNHHAFNELGGLLEAMEEGAE